MLLLILMKNCKFCSDTGYTEQLFVRHKFAAHLILSWGFPVSGEQEILFFFFSEKLWYLLWDGESDFYNRMLQYK